MTDTNDAMRVTSPDGTKVAYWVAGDEGPPLLLVHGTTADHTRWGPLLPHLTAHATVYVVDRRGRGSSGDAGLYSAAREFEDVAAVVDAIARAHGTAVDLYGHSYGALCALGAAALTDNVRKLVLYEPAIAASDAQSDATVDSMDELLERGEREAVVEMLFRDVLGMTADELAMFKAAPSWAGRVAAAHTVPRPSDAGSGTCVSPSPSVVALAARQNRIILIL